MRASGMELSRGGDWGQREATVGEAVRKGDGGRLVYGERKRVYTRPEGRAVVLSRMQ